MKHILNKMAEMLPKKYYSKEEIEGAKINAWYFMYYASSECYRELLVSYMPIIPLLQKQVRLEEADYILYGHAYARCDDMSEAVCEDLREIAKIRKKTAEIIVVGKSANAKNLLNGEIENITFVGDHYAEYLGKRFGFPEVKEEYFVYDEYFEQLNIWPVDGCNNKCAFCRRSYMYIRFESQKYTFIKKQLDWYQKNEPEKMRHISLRAENLTEYGIDLYDKPMLHKIIELINSYEAVEEITIEIGMCIGEITPQILKALCNAKKIKEIALNLEAGSDRLLKFIGKKHTYDWAVEVFTKLRQANPSIAIETTVMIGLPTETISDMYNLAELIRRCWPDYVHTNYYINSPHATLNQYPQLSESLREYHLKIFLKRLQIELKAKNKYIEIHPNIYLRHYFIWGKRRKSRKWIRKKMGTDRNNESHDFPKEMPFQRVIYVEHENGLSKRWREYW